MIAVATLSHFNSSVSMEILGRGKPNYPIWLHEDVPDFTQGKADLHQRLGLVLQHLMAYGRTGVVKGCRGSIRGWRRSPMGGRHGMHYYLWWTMADSIQSRGQGFLGDNGIAVRQVRHHDEHSYLPFGKEGDYYELTPSDLQDGTETFVGLPLTTVQREFAVDASPVRILHGQPGSGKTTALWHAITDWRHQRVLYLTWSSELTERARAHFAVFALGNTDIDARPYPAFLRALSQSARTYSSPAESFAAFKDIVARHPVHALGPWAGREYALYAEMRALLVGCAVPALYACRPCNGVNLLSDAAYNALGSRSGGVGPQAAKALLNFVKMLPADLLTVLFPDLSLAAAAIQRLRADDVPTRWSALDRIVVDEVQDLTALEIAVTLELCAAIRRRRGYGPWLLLTGDEGQTVQPSGFQWAVLNTLLARYRHATPRTFSLTRNLRCPGRIVDVIDNASTKYKELNREYRPHKQARLASDETVDARLFYVAISTPNDAGRLLERLQEFENLIILSLEAEAPAWMPASAKHGVLTPEMVKGLEYQSVCLLNPGLSLGKLDAALRANTKASELEQHAYRTAIDRLRVALSRATETLVCVDVGVSTADRQLSQSLLGPVVVLAPDDLIMHFEDAETSTDEKILAWTHDARQFVDTNPAFAWQRAGQAWRWLALLRHEAVDATVRREAQSAVLDIAARWLVAGVPTGIDQDEITALAHEVLEASSASKRHVVALERLTAWSRNREEGSFALLSAAVALDANHWLAKALPYASQVFLQLMEEHACKPRAARYFTDADAVAEWLRLIGFAGDVLGKARDMQHQAAEATLQAEKEKQRKTAQKNYEKGIALLKRNKKKEAIQKFLETTRLDPEHAEAFYQIGCIYSNSHPAPKEHYEIAIEHLNKVIILKPKGVDALIQRGVAYRRSGNFDKAMTDFNKAIKIDPKNAKAYNRRGVVYAQCNQYNKALEDYSQAIKLNSKFAEAYGNRGNIYQRMGEFEKAENDHRIMYNLLQSGE